VPTSVKGAHTEWSTIKIHNTCITNVYHPPNSILDIRQLPVIYDQHIVSGDFNCHHELWGYQSSNPNGENLANRTSNYNLQVVYDPKQPATFESRRWHTGTNPDVTFCTTVNGVTPTREVLDRFPLSQHCPYLI